MFRFENRRLDAQNRLTLPAEALTELKIPREGEVSIRLSGDSLIITASEPQCSLCGRIGEIERRGRFALCPSCLREIGAEK